MVDVPSRDEFNALVARVTALEGTPPATEPPLWACGMFHVDDGPQPEGGTWDVLLGYAENEWHQVAFVAHEPNEQGGWSNFEGSAWFIGDGGAGNKSRSLSLAVGFFPNGEGATIEEAATGAYNQHYTTVANHIAPHWPSAVIRPAWEFNGTWYPWSRCMAADQDGYASNYIAAFRHLVEAFRAVSPQYRFCFNPNADIWGQPRPWDCYPGNDWCDLIGLDLYDQPDASHPDPVDRWASVQQPALDDLWWHSNELGRPIALPEWGAGKAGDNPYFVDKASEWIKGSQLGGGRILQSYWNEAVWEGAAYTAGLNDFPLQKARFIAQWTKSSV